MTKRKLGARGARRMLAVPAVLAALLVAGVPGASAQVGRPAAPGHHLPGPHSAADHKPLRPGHAGNPGAPGR
ncbi:MAG: hypothetical protein JST53_03245 [Actinobacteria bacterium]|nr:hypothetical protein [Actinomycetota bacterium]